MFIVVILVSGGRLSKTVLHITAMAMACRDQGTLDDRRYKLLMAIPNPSVSEMDDLLQARREIELLKRAVRVINQIYASNLLDEALGSI